MLCYKPGDTRLSEISIDIKGDYGQPFATDLITGLIHVNQRDRFEFMWVRQGEVEFAQPEGQIDVELSGITREAGFKPIGEINIIPETINNQWTFSAWTTHPWSEITAGVSGFAETSMKRYFRVQKDVNAYQYRVSTNDINAACTVRTLQIRGAETQGGVPRSWESQTV